MSIRFAAVLALMVTTASALGQAPATAPAASAPAPANAFKTDKERIGYAIGLQIGKNLEGVEIDSAALAAGIHDSATAGTKLQMSDAEVEATLKGLQQQMIAKAEADQASSQKAGVTFLEENAKKEGVKTTASGLQYKVIKAGAGKMPKATDTVSVNYRGTLVSGKVFDASEMPVTFPVNGVIPGWTEALQLMKEGDKWQLFIPSKLAYAERGAGRDIGPNETLIFEVELLAVNPPGQ